MDRYRKFIFPIVALILTLSCTAPESAGYPGSLESKPAGSLVREQAGQVWFDDRTEDVVAHAERLIEKNEREGAALNQRWYTLKRFGEYQDVIFSASKIVFYGGLEHDVRRLLANQYSSIVPVKDDQSEGDIRLYFGERTGAAHDLIIIGQNGREVALKTIIRLIYLAKFADEGRKQKDSRKFKSFNKSLKVFHSSISPKEEFIRFFNRHGINHPDVVMIGFRGDIRSLLRQEGVPDPESYADESLRVNWYPNAHGKKVLLVSIDENRIYASRSGALIEAILGISPDNPPAMTFLGIGGVIDEPEIVGTIVTPTVVLNGDRFPANQNKGVLVHIIANRAVDETSIRTAHASVENVIVETTQWADRMKRLRVRTVDQELFHLVNGINASANARTMEIFAGILLTDNVSSKLDANMGPTLEHAEETISKTAAVRQAYLSKLLTKMGLIKLDKSKLPPAIEITR
jgi:hypothetical protein